MKNLLIIPAIVLACTPMMSRANELKMQVGLWQIAISIHVAGIPMDLPAQMIKKCITAADLKNAESSIMQPQNLPGSNEQCKLSKLVQTGNSLTWKGTCSGDSEISFSGSMNFDSADHYTGGMDIQGTLAGHPMRMNETMEGHRIAASCTN